LFLVVAKFSDFLHNYNSRCSLKSYIKGQLKNLKEFEAATKKMSAISKKVYDFMMQ
jgi:hypothetical protein